MRPTRARSRSIAPASENELSMSVPAVRRTSSPPSLISRAIEDMWLGTQGPSGRRSMAVRSAKWSPVGKARWRGPKPPPARPSWPVSAGRVAMARPGCQPWRCLYMLAPPTTIMAGLVVAYSRASLRIFSAGSPVSACGPLGSEALEVLRIGLVAHGLGRDELARAEPLGDDHVGHAERQRGVGARTDQPRLVGVARGLGAPDVDGDDARAAPARLDQVGRGSRLARQVGAPEDDEPRMRGHVFLGIRLDHARERESIGAHGPADDGRVPHLHAAQVTEAHEERPVDPGHVRAVAEPDAHSLPPGRGHGGDDAIERVVPGDGAPAVFAAPAVPHEGLGEAKPVVGDLGGGAAPDAEEAAAVGIVLIALDALQPSVLRHLDQHPAVRRVAVHRAHGADERGRHGRNHTSPLPRARAFC